MADINDKQADEPFTVGEFVIITSGSYSNYSVDALCRVMKPFAMQDFIIRAAGTGTIMHAGRFRDQMRRDFETLVRDGYLEEVPARLLDRDWMDE